MALRHAGWVALWTAAILAGCGGSNGPQPPEKVESADAAAPRGKAQKQAPSQKAASRPTVESATPAASTAAATEPERRFDMVQDGKPQTAENFEAWMETQGVQVAEGADSEAPAKSAAEAGIETKAKTEPAASSDAGTR